MSAPISLPANATDASQRRAELALTLAQSCPPTLASEIALTGSTAHGFADDDSDLELNLWSEAIPPEAERVEWLLAAGAADIHVESAPRSDDSYWIGFQIGDIPAEIGWQTFAALRENVERILSGTVTERKVLTFAEILTSAIPLRTSGRLPAWQAMLNAYPDAVQRPLVETVIAQWSDAKRLASARRLARRSEILTLNESLLAELDAALRLLYAVYRRWEPSRKWTLTVARQFAPQALLTQFNAVLSDPSPEHRVDLCVRFCLDVLALVPEGFDTGAAVAVLRSEL